MSKPLTIIRAMNDPALFKPWFKGKSWGNWKVFLKALFSLPMTPKDRKVFKQFTGRTKPPKQVREAWLPVGRRGGKSIISALVAVYLACFREYGEYLGPGERLTISVIAADRRQARVCMRYIVGFLEGVPMLNKLIERKTQETVDLTNQVTIEVHTTSYRSVRGYTLGAVIADEISFWRSDDSASPDKEIIAALRPGMASIPGSLLIAISSPYSRRGSLWETYRKYYGKDGATLVWQASTQDMNSTIDPHIIKTAYEEDPIAASAEFGAQFRRDIEALITLENAQKVINLDRPLELPYSGKRGFGFFDASGGSGGDSMTGAVAHREGERLVLDCIREIKPPFNPETACKEFAAMFRNYKVTTVTADRYAGDWPKVQFRKHGIDVKPTKLTKSEIYLELVPLINSERVELPNHKRLIAQLCGLERRTSRGGRDSIDHGPGPHSHDDLINSVAGSLVMASKKKKSLNHLALSFTYPKETRPDPFSNTGGGMPQRPGHPTSGWGWEH